MGYNNPSGYYWIVEYTTSDGGHYGDKCYSWEMVMKKTDQLAHAINIKINRFNEYNSHFDNYFRRKF